MAVLSSSEYLRKALTEPQRRALITGVRRLERTLDLLESLLAPGEHTLRYTVYAQDIPAEQAADLRATLAEARAALARLATLIGVEPERFSTRMEFAAEAAEAWASFEDLHPRQLKRYGHVEPDAAAAVAPLIEQIAAILLRLATSTGTPPAPEATP